MAYRLQVMNCLGPNLLHVTFFPFWWAIHSNSDEIRSLEENGYRINREPCWY
jgi:hypothetical protein